MKIVGKGNKVIDADLLARLAVDKQSGSTVSKAEAEKAIKSITTELKDDFETSTRGLARAEQAVTNTLSLALTSGWLRSGSAANVIKAFLDGTGKGSLSEAVKNVRDSVRTSRPPRGRTYGGYQPSTTPTRPAPRPSRTRPAGT
ncbi:MAG: hypothetical protein ABIJ09_16420 [Pseudomonadota bacterium]